jgi:hypothetical protein
MADSDKYFSMDWRVILGMVLTTAWITAGLSYLLGIVGWAHFIHLPTGDIGSFLEGAFAPLAFLWLVIGHFMQQKEITANTKAISLQEKSARRLELHSRRDSYFKLLSLVQDQLGSIAAFHYISVFGETGTGKMSFEEFAENRAHISNGDHAYFIRLMTTESFRLREDPDMVQDMYFGTDVRTRHTDNYVKTFEKLLNAAREIDTDEMISNALLHGSAAGRQYRIIKLLQGGDAEELDLYI